MLRDLTYNNFDAGMEPWLSILETSDSALLRVRLQDDIEEQGLQKDFQFLCAI